jgi:hypothetical protein
MNWREHSWEFVVGAISWIVALVALACLGVFVAVDAAQRHWTQRRAQKISRPSPAVPRIEDLELVS